MQAADVAFVVIVIGLGLIGAIVVNVVFTSIRTAFRCWRVRRERDATVNWSELD